MAEVRWSTLARRQFRSIIEYVAGDSISGALTLRTRIDTAASRLVGFPLLGRVVSDFQDAKVRELIVGHYRLVYRVDGHMIFIVTVVHGSRDLNSHLPDGPWDIE